MRAILILGLTLSCLVAPVGAQDKEEKKKEEKPHRGLAHLQNLDKALQYAKSQKSEMKGLVPELFAGLAYMLDGRDEYKEDFEAAVSKALSGYKCTPEQFNTGNWNVIYAGLFLAIVNLREPREEIQTALKDWVEFADQHAEATGGWGHHKGYAAKEGYVARGGATDLSIMTAAMLTAMLIAKKSGVEMPESVIERSIKNLNGLATKGGFAYGNGNKYGERAMSRVAAAYVGCRVAGKTSPPFYKAAEGSVPRAFQSAQSGHAYGPVHFFWIALAMKLMGRYAEFARYWLPKLSAEQKADGSVKMLNDGRKDGESWQFPHSGGSTSVYALMILLQKYDLFPTPKKAGKKKGGAPRKSPFGSRKKKK